jgi:hypothetical protein
VTSAAQVNANRRNARRSTGPRTPLGLRASSQNARRHGLTAAPPGEAVLAHLRAILSDPSATPKATLETPLGTAALALATAEARLDRALEHAATMAIRQPLQELREEVEMVADALLDPEFRFDLEAQTSRHRLLLRLKNFAAMDDERSLRAARRHLSEAHASRRKAFLNYMRLKA